MLSRSRLFRFEPLGHEQTLDLLKRALADPERGYGNRQIAITDEAIEHLAFVASGDARTAFNALELAVASTRPTPTASSTTTPERSSAPFWCLPRSSTSKDDVWQANSRTPPSGAQPLNYESVDAL